MAKVCTSDGEFEPAKEDHRYKGIEGAFIRYISQRPNYYRAIYIRRGDDVYWYRAGRHNVEDRLEAPSDLSSAASVGQTPSGVDAMEQFRHPRYMKSTSPRYLREVLSARTLIPHKQMILVSPSLTKTLISPVGLIGLLISRVQQFGGYVTIITRPPRSSDIDAYRSFASRGIELHFHEQLNSRLYYFEVDAKQLDSEMSHVKSIGIVGSSELTEKSLNIVPSRAGEEYCLPDSVSEELCYEISEDDLEGAMEYCLDLASSTIDFETYIAQLNC